MVAPSQDTELRERLAAVQTRLTQARNDAFVDYTPVVCGLALRPITQRSYRQLIAWQNGFVTGGPVDFKAIAQFIWAHHPEFSQFPGAVRRRVFRCIDRELHPRFPTLIALARFFRPFAPRSPVLRWFATMEDAADRHATVIGEIRRLAHEAIRDFPCSGADENAAPFAQLPSMVSLLERAHTISFSEALAVVETAPLRQLVEYLREAIHRLTQGKDKLLTAEESRVWADWLDHKQSELSDADNQKSSIENRK
jgi:hypothetical protein